MLALAAVLVLVLVVVGVKTGAAVLEEQRTTRKPGVLVLPHTEIAAV